MIDTHCHLDVAAFDADRDAVVTRATAAGVLGIVLPAIPPPSWARGPATPPRQHAGAPQIAPELDPGELAGDLTARLAEAARDACAIGECGLDGGTAAHELQEQNFRAPPRAPPPPPH